MKVISVKENEPIMFSFPPQPTNKDFGAAALPREVPVIPLTNIQNTLHAAGADSFFSTPPNPTKKLELLLTEGVEPVQIVNQSTEVMSNANDIVMWKKPVASIKVLAGLTACSIMYGCIARHDHSSIFLWLGRLLLLDVGLNFCKSMISIKWQQKGKLEGGLLVMTAVKESKKVIELLAWLHDKYLCSDNPTVTLKAVVSLWVLCTIASWARTSTIITVFMLAIFILPPLHMRYSDRTSEAVQAFKQQSQDLYKSFGLSWKFMILPTTVFIVLVTRYTTWENMALATLVGLIAIRCQLKPNEVQALQNAAQPYARSVKKAGQAFTTAANGYIARMTPIPAKRRPHFY